MSSRRADLYPPLGINGGPCKVVNRILQNVKNVRDQEALIRDVENNVSLTNAQSAIVYPTINKERGAPPFTPLHFTSHSQYRMDLRGITVPDVQESVARFRDVAERAMAKRDTRVMDKFRADPRFDDSKNNLSVVTGPQRDHLNIVSVFPFPFTPDPKAPPGGCPRPKKADYRAPAGDLAGVHTFVSEKPLKGIYEPLGDTVEHLPGESPKSDRSRAKPQRTDTRENLERHTPANAVFNTPGPSEPGQKIHVRSPGTPGEDYGHPFKLNIMPRRTEAALYPSYNDKQRSQKGPAKKYYKKYYLRHKSKLKARAKIKYLHNKTSPTFKKDKSRRNSQKYGWRFKRLPAGGYRSNADRARDIREKRSTGLSVPFTHPNYGAGNVMDVRDQEVLIEQTDPMGGEALGTGTVPFFTFLRGADFDTEEGLEAFFDLADADFNDEDPEDEESLRLATFYRETFTPGYNLDPGDGVRDLGAVSPYAANPALKHYDFDRDDRAPAEMMNNISPTDNNPGSAKVIPSGHGFVNKEASAIRVAAKMAEILQGIDPGVQSRSLSVTPKLQRSDVGNIVYSFKVPGSKGETYTVKVKGIPTKGVKTLSKMDLKLSCSCNFWQFQGPEHWAKVGDYLYGKPRGTAAVPDIKDPSGKHRLCKHALATLGVIKKWPAFGKR